MELFYTKEFCNTATGMILKNTDPVAEYCNRILQALWETKDDVKAQRNIKCRFLSDFVAVFEYDLAHAVLPEPEGSFKTVEEKAGFQRRRLLVQDFSLYIGKTFFLYHKNLFRNDCFPILYTPHMIVNYQELYETAFADYRRVVMRPSVPLVSNETKKYKTVDSCGNEKQITIPISNSNKNHAVAATYILPSLIEHKLIISLKNYVLDKWLKGLEGKELEQDETNIYGQFRRIHNANYGFLVGDKSDMEKRIWNIGRKYNILPEDKDMKCIFCTEGMMLNQILKSKFAKDVIAPEYMSLLNFIFLRDNLNLRNNIAHCNSTTYDYLDIKFVSVLFQILMDLAAGVIVEA